MGAMIFCVKHQQTLEGLDRAPYPGALGQKIFQNISKLAWSEWMTHQTMLINENRLMVTEPSSRAFLEKEMEQYFFGEGSQTPPDFKPPST